MSNVKKKKKCFWHCFHVIPDTQRVVERYVSCEKIVKTVLQRDGTCYVKFEEKCCHCDKERIRELKDYNAFRAAEAYPTEEEYNFLIQIKHWLEKSLE